MNSMLANVTARIREIGIRKALGATKREIRLQFLTEAVFLSLCGGVVGTSNRHRSCRSPPFTLLTLRFTFPISGWSAVDRFVNECAWWASSSERCRQIARRRSIRWRR